MSCFVCESYASQPRPLLLLSSPPAVGIQTFCFSASVIASLFRFLSYLDERKSNCLSFFFQIVFPKKGGKETMSLGFHIS